MIFDNLKFAVLFLFLQNLCFPIHASIWKSVDQFGVVSYSNSRPQRGADLILGASQDVGTGSQSAYSTNCTRTCNQPVPNWWRKSKKYLALEGYLADASRENGIDRALLEAIAATESAFEVDAVSGKGAVGVMQVMPITARQYGVTGAQRKDIELQLKKPSVNIGIAARHLSYLHKKYGGRLELVLAAYNAGEVAVAQASNRIPDFDETKKYVANVMHLYSMAKGRENTRPRNP